MIKEGRSAMHSGRLVWPLLGVVAVEVACDVYRTQAGYDWPAFFGGLADVAGAMAVVVGAFWTYRLFAMTIRT